LSRFACWQIGSFLIQNLISLVLSAKVLLTVIADFIKFNKAASEEFFCQVKIYVTGGGPARVLSPSLPIKKIIVFEGSISNGLLSPFLFLINY